MTEVQLCNESKAGYLFRYLFLILVYVHIINLFSDSNLFAQLKHTGSVSITKEGKVGMWNFQ